MGQNARDLSRDIAVDEKLNPQTSAWLGSNYEEYKKLDEQGLVDKPNVGQAENQQADKQDTLTKEPKTTRQAENLSQENHHQNQGDNKKPQPTTPKSDSINGVSGSVKASETTDKTDKSTEQAEKSAQDNAEEERQRKEAEKQKRIEARLIREERLKQNTDGKTAFSQEDFAYNINLSSERNAMKHKAENRLAELKKGGIGVDEKEEANKIKAVLKDIQQHEKQSNAQVGFWTKVGSSLPEIPQWLVDGSAGFGDGVSFGFSKWARKQLDIDNVNTNSQVYLASEFGGEMYQLVAGGVATLGSKGLMLTGKVQKVAHWTPSHVSTNTLRAGDWVMTGSSKGLVGHINHYLSGVGVPKKLVSKFLPEKYANKIITREYPFKSGFETVVPKKDLSWPPGREKIKGLMGQRIYSPKNTPKK